MKGIFVCETSFELDKRTTFDERQPKMEYNLIWKTIFNRRQASMDYNILEDAILKKTPVDSQV